MSKAPDDKNSLENSETKQNNTINGPIESTEVSLTDTPVDSTVSADFKDVPTTEVMDQDVKNKKLASPSESPASIANANKSIVDVTKWTPEMNTCFIQLLIAEAPNNYYDESINDWSSTSWDTIIDQLKLKFPLKASLQKFTKIKLKKHYKILHQEYEYWKLFKNNMKNEKSSKKSYWWDESHGCFVFKDSHMNVDRYFAHFDHSKDSNSTMLLKAYHHKKNWFKKFCTAKVAEYLSKFDEYLTLNDKHNIYKKNNEGGLAGTNYDLAGNNDDDDDEEEDDDDEEEEDISNKNEVIIDDIQSNNVNNGDQDDDNEETNKLDNELLELTGYGTTNNNGSISESKLKKRKLSARKVQEDQLQILTFEQWEAQELKQSNLKISRIVMKFMLKNNYDFHIQKKLSKLIQEDWILFNFLNDEEEFSLDDKEKYLDIVVNELI